MATEEKRLLSLLEARQSLGGIGHTTIYELINRGEIVNVHIGRRSFVTSKSLGEYVDRITAATASGQ